MPSLRLLAGLALAAAALPAAAAENTQVTIQNKIAQCQGCHGIEDWKTAFPEVYHVPRLGGQKPTYIVAALKAYKAGDRHFPTMQAIAADLTEQDMQELAKYFGGEHGAGEAKQPTPAEPSGKK